MMSTAAFFLLPLLLLTSCLLQYCHGTREIIDLLSKTLIPIQQQELASEWTNFTVSVAPQDRCMEADKIDALPGQPEVNFNQYSGYVTVQPTAGRALFYYFVEAAENPSSKPLLLWLSGGPVYSSLAHALSDLGLFIPNSDNKTLHINPYAWNKVANVLFLESPVGVGFSYSNTTADYTSPGDTRTAHDSYAFLINWLERFPQYETRDFFLTGSSYAGHYVPELAATILAFNKASNTKTTINLKGIFIGNPIFDWKDSILASYDFIRNNSLISNNLYHDLTTYCKLEPTYNNIDIDYGEDPKCNAAQIELSFAFQKKFDLYNIKAPLCYLVSNSNASARAINSSCSGVPIEAYINLPKVQRALHANVHQWESCSITGVRSKWIQAPARMLPIVKYVVDSKIRVWVYSGALDAEAPSAATERFLRLLLPNESPSRPWYANGQLAGDVFSYKGLTFATVAEAGHGVTQDQPTIALALLCDFLGGNALPFGK